MKSNPNDRKTLFGEGAEKRRPTLERILALRDPRRLMLQELPKQGQFLLTGSQVGGSAVEKRLGYCVQIRKGAVELGTDVYFLRHADGSLTTHENQFFYALSPEQEALARTVFTHLPENEDYGLGYRCTDKVLRTGFLVSN